MSFPIVCHGCGNRKTATRIDVGMRCAACGSDDLDLDLEKNASSGGTGWNQTLPDPHDGWAEYAGPKPGPNPKATEHTDGNEDAYGDYNYFHGHPDYLPGGGYEKSTWPMPPTTSVPPIEDYDPGAEKPESGGARWQGRTSAVVPLHVTLPDGTQWEGTGRVVSSATKTSKATKIAKAQSLILKTNPGLTKEEAHSLAVRSVEKWNN